MSALPEPDTHCYDEDTGLNVWSYSAEQMLAALTARRARVIEECARVCDARVMGDNNREDEEAKRCAADVRALKGQA